MKKAYGRQTTDTVKNLSENLILVFDIIERVHAQVTFSHLSLFIYM